MRRRKVDFVTHSMGGILVRAWLKDHRPANLGKVVMLAPPNQGSAAVDAYAKSGFSGAGAGGKGTRNRPGQHCAAAGAGQFRPRRDRRRQIRQPILSSKLEGPNDGTVTVASTKTEGHEGSHNPAAGHTFLMNNPLVIAQVLTFLKKGRFDHGWPLRRRADAQQEQFR